MNYPVFETFHSWQGEGNFIGQSAFFIRLYGCPIQCEWCDSSSTWKKSNTPQFKTIDENVLTELAVAAHPDFIVITGGEPTIHNLQPLCTALHNKGLSVHLETSGAFPISKGIDWITISPKKNREPLLENWINANEIKLIVEDETSINYWKNKMPKQLKAKSIWLHPEWSKATNISLLNYISNYVIKNGSPFRAGWQLHKLYNAD